MDDTGNVIQAKFYPVFGELGFDFRHNLAKKSGVLFVNQLEEDASTNDWTFKCARKHTGLALFCNVICCTLGKFFVEADPTASHIAWNLVVDGNYMHNKKPSE